MKWEKIYERLVDIGEREILPSYPGEKYHINVKRNRKKKGERIRKVKFAKELE